MKKILFIISILLIYFPVFYPKNVMNAEVFLLTCGPGTETYSIYGHSALRISDPENNSDAVYNWGVFDFSTSNFAWKFAKGRLDYTLVSEPLQRFLQIYFFEKRYVYSQKLNLDSIELERLIVLVNENLKPENLKYRYDFFYDDCSTRIRDLLEKAIGKKLLYPPVETGKIPTFRNMVGKYQSPYPWLNFGIDLIMGSPGEKVASFRDRMFLPIDLKKGLSEAVINRDDKMIPLLQNPETILDFEPLVTGQKFITSPAIVFTLVLIIVLILSATMKDRKKIKIFDVIVFTVFSVLASLMIFFNFFTDHQQMKWNLNILWLNPFLLVCLGALIMNKITLIWFKIVFYISGAFLVIHFILPQEFNIATIPLIVIILVRSSVRAGFEWNPISLS